MNNNSEDFALTLFFQGRKYLWPEVLQSVRSQLNYPASTEVWTVAAKNTWLTTLTLIQAYEQSKCVFPFPNGLPESDLLLVIKQLENNYRQSVADHHSISEFSLAVATSGSQAKFKIALISRVNILAHYKSFVGQVLLNRSSVWLNCMPLQHIAGIMILYRCGLSQATMVLHEHFEAQNVWFDLHQYAVSHISLVPAMLSQLLAIQLNSEHSQIPDSLKYVIVGGDQLAPALHQQAITQGWPILLSYGMTEATSTIALGKTADKLTPLKGLELRASPDQALRIRGDMVISAYAEGQMDSFDRGWFKTSDLISMTQGFLQVLGRSDDMIICGGENMSPAYLESLFIKCPAIRDIAVGKVDNEQWGDSIAVLVSGDVEAFKAWLKNNIQPRYQPRMIKKVSEIPRNVLGKIERRRVKTIIVRK